MKIILLATILTLGIIITTGTLQQASAVNPTFQVGDVFAGVNGGNFNWHHPDGTLNTVLNCGFGGFTTGGAFDAAGNFYGTMFSNNAVCVWDTSGVSQGTIGGGYLTPESIVFDNAGNFYVGNLGNGFLKFDAAGNPSGMNPIGNFRVDWMDLAADQCTMYYGQEGNNVLLHDVCIDAPGGVFAVGLTQAFAMRLLPNGDLLVADLNNVKRFNSLGILQQTYNTVAPISGWFALNLDPDGTSFWSGSFNNDNFYKFDIVTGNVLIGPINTGGGGNLFGLAIFGEPTAAVQPIGGEILPISTTALLLAGISTNVMWLIPLVAIGGGAFALLRFQVLKGKN